MSYNMEPIIEVVKLGKRYSFPVTSNDKSTLRDFIVGIFNNYIKIFTGKKAHNYDSFWALKDISLKIKKGEIVGVMGRNGSGKSTLLKVLSNITIPTEGKVILRERVTALLEVGTGFHPELSGKENVFLNATLLGMRQSIIKERFEQIVEYSGVREFINMPVKHYSTGMYARLAFSIAIHSDPRILILDEVMSFGDIEFQQKSYNTLQNIIKNNGVTVIYVSHSIDTIKSLAKRILIIDKGRIVGDGDFEEMTTLYENIMKVEN